MSGNSFRRKLVVRRWVTLIAAPLIALSVTCTSPIPLLPGSNVVVNPLTGVFDLYVHPDEARLYELASDAGEIITAYGVKDANGVPTDATTFFYQTPDQVGSDAGTWVHFDSEGRITRIVGDDGAVIDFAWQADGTVLISAISGDGSGQVNTSADVGSDAALAAAKPADDAAKAIADPGALAAQEGTNQAADGTQATLVIANLRRCGAEPNAADVQNVYMTIENAPGAPTYPAVRLDSGRYAATIPLVSTGTTIPIDTLEPICTSLGRIAIKACKDADYAARVENQLCGKLAAALDASSIGGSAGNSISNACRNGFQALKGHCLEILLGAIGGVNPGDAICPKIKEVIENTFGSSEPVLVSATATIRGAGTQKSSPVDISTAVVVGGPPPQVSIDFGNNLQVLSATTDPADPGAAQSYVIRVEVACAAGASVEITVSGTDGYSNAQTYTTQEAQATFTLSVPGAASSIRDTIQVLVGGGANRTIQIVF